MAGMQPIRWDNIDGGGIAQAGSPMMNAASLFSNAFGNAKDVLNQSAATDASNWQIEKKNNTNNFLNSLYAKYTNPDDLQAAIKSGDVAKQLAGYGNQIDSDAARGAADARLQALQQQAITGVNYKNTMTDFEQQGLKDQIGTLFASNDPVKMAQAQALLDAHNEIRNKAALQTTGTNALHQNIVWDQDKKKFALDQRVGENNIVTSLMNAHANQISAGAAATNAQTGQLNAALNQRQFAEQMTDKYLERDKALRGEAAAYAAYNNPLSADGLTSMNTQIKAAAPDPETEVLWRQAALEAAKQPGATVGSVLQTVMGMDKNRIYKSQLWQLHNATVAGAENAASDSNKALVDQNNSSLGRVRQQLQDHAAALKTNQAANWGLPSIPGLTGSTGVAAMAGTGASAHERPMGPSSTVTPSGSMDQQAALAAQMDRDPAVQATQAASRRISADAAANKYGPHGYIGDVSTPNTPYTPPPIAQTVGNDPKVKALQDKLASINSKDKLTADDIFAKQDAEASLRMALKDAQNRALSDARSASLKKLDLNSIINQSAFPPPIIR